MRHDNIRVRSRRLQPATPDAPPQGTHITSGRCRAVVVGTGAATAIGRIRDAMVASQVRMCAVRDARIVACLRWQQALRLLRLCTSLPAASSCG